MEKVLAFLGEAAPCFVATVEDGEPRIRPQGFFMPYDGKICFCTADEKQSSIQLKKNPAVEIAACQGTKFIRIRGKAEFLGEDAVKAALEKAPHLENIVKPGKFEIFAVAEPSIVIADLATGEKEVI